MRIFWRTFLLLLTIAICSCNEKEDVLSTHFFDYPIRIKFENQSGDNLLKGIKCENFKDLFPELKTDPNPDWMFIDRNLYRFEYKGSSQTILQSNSFMHYTIINNEEYIDLEFTSIDIPQSSISSFLRCEQIFGDKKEHEIVAHFSHHDSTDKNERLTGVTFDGVEQKVEDNARVTITIDR